MNGTWLVIESSGRVGQLGLLRDGAFVRSRRLEESRRLARDLASNVGAMLLDEQLEPKDVAGVMVSVGPGSYTGLRVGITSAKTFAYATKCPLIAVPTFHAIALQAPDDAKQIWVVADALQGLVYVQEFIAPSRPISPLEESVGRNRAFLSHTELRIDRAEILGDAPSDVWFTGPGIAVHGARLPPHALVVGEADRDPKLESVYRAASSLSPLSKEALFALEPLYLRGSSAEEKAKANEPRG
jgi:tRNA threonylcarbamoyladenosine biosynthesis protein TsaB